MFTLLAIPPLAKSWTNEILDIGGLAIDEQFNIKLLPVTAVLLTTLLPVVGANVNSGASEKKFRAVAGHAC